MTRRCAGAAATRGRLAALANEDRPDATKTLRLAVDKLQARQRSSASRGGARKVGEQPPHRATLARHDASAARLEPSRSRRAVLGYIDGRRVIEMAAELDVTRGAINRWLQWYEADGVEGLVEQRQAC